MLGKVALPFAKQTYEQKLATWKEWADVSVASHGYWYSDFRLTEQGISLKE
ncbi:hypothetical protein [Flavobacterium sp. RS13.1]|uniref:hypothetical protein n=1 Tax=Flavobacterium sp. RS13.1 TaxID=3400345 RepID=UPI003AACBCB6